MSREYGYITNDHIVEALRGSAGVVTVAAAKLGVSRRTINTWISESEDLRSVLSEVREETLDLAEAQLLTLIRNGDRESIRFYLRCFGKNRGWVETTRIEGPGGGPVLTLAAPPSMTTEAFEQIAKQLSAEI